jgi:DNA-binding MarR family transcriptional regulator
MENKKCLAPDIRKTSHAIKCAVDRQCDATLPMRLTGFEGMLLGYMCEINQVTDAQKIMQEFHVKKASLSVSLHTLENKGFISMLPLISDKRKKCIRVTKKGIDAHEKFKGILDYVTDNLVKGLNEDEIDVFLKTCEKIRNNAEKI